MALIGIAQFNILQRYARMPLFANDQPHRPETNIEIWIGLGNTVFNPLLQPDRHRQTAPRQLAQTHRDRAKAKYHESQQPPQRTPLSNDSRFRRFGFGCLYLFGCHAGPCYWVYPKLILQ